MELLNVGFAILLIKVVICVVPAALGIFLIVSSEDTKRGIRGTVCNKLFGLSNAIPFAKFTRFLYILSVLMLVFSFVASWFLLLRGFF